MSVEDEGAFLDWPAGSSREEQRAKEIEFAKQYLVFVTDERARALLEFWESIFVRTSTSVESSIQRYAADEAKRDFIRKIRDQITLAQSDNR